MEILSSTRIRIAALALAMAAVLVGLAWYYVSQRTNYPAPLAKYVAVIEANGGTGFADFRVEVSDLVCPGINQTNFEALSGSHDDAVLTVTPAEITLRITRLFGFLRTLIIYPNAERCSAFVESHWL